MFDGQGERVGGAAQVEVGVAPGVEFGGAAQGLSGAQAAGGFLGVMDDEDRQRVAALEFTQVSQQGCDLAAGILVDAMQPYEGIEDQEARAKFGNRALQS